MMNDDFCAFILTHGRPDNVITYRTLERQGYTGKIYIIIDDEDKTADRYYEVFGDKVIMFDKKAIAETFDEGDNFDDRRAIVYARNACFDIAKDLGIKYFIQLDDDYYWFGYRTEKGGCSVKSLDGIFDAMLNFFKKTNTSAIAMSQGGDHIGGYDPQKTLKRKAMNSFICSTNRPFRFVGRINEDVNSYTSLGGVGIIFFSIMQVQLDQKDTQQNDGGMTDIYVDSGTYIKSFYTVIFSPSCTKIRLMGTSHKRLHHSISWANAVPVILDEKYKIK